MVEFVSNCWINCIFGNVVFCMYIVVFVFVGKSVVLFFYFIGYLLCLDDYFIDMFYCLGI